MVELRHLVYFRTIAELGSIAKAATALHLTQPTLSRQLALLERTVGHRLVRRTSRGVVLTPAGEGLRELAAAVVAQVDRIPEILSAAARRERLVRIGVPPGVPVGWFTRFRDALAAGKPPVRLSVHEATSDEQEQLLRAGLIDIGLLHAEPKGLRSTHVLTQRFGCVVRRRSLFPDAESVEFADLEGLRVLAHSSVDEQARLRATTQATGTHIEWTFRKFANHGELIAHGADADLVLLTEASATRHFPHARWVPMRPSAAADLELRTWAGWTDPNLPDLARCLRAMRSARHTDHAGHATR